MAPDTTPVSWPRGSPGRSSASSRSVRTWRPTRSPAFVAAELADAPELFHQRGYLARVLTADPAGGMRDDGVQPLAHVLDEGGPGRARGDARGATDRARSTRSSTPASAGRIAEHRHRTRPADALRHDRCAADDRGARRTRDSPRVAWRFVDARRWVASARMCRVQPGGMLWLWWNTLSGSTRRLTCDQPVPVRAIRAAHRRRRPDRRRGS